MGYCGPHLGVDGEAAVELVAGFCEESHGEFALEHEYTDSGCGGGSEELEG